MLNVSTTFSVHLQMGEARVARAGVVWHLALCR